MEADEEEDKKGKEKENKVLLSLSLSPPPTFPTFKRRDIKGGSRHHSPHTQKKKALFDFLLWDLLSLLKCLIGSINF